MKRYIKLDQSIIERFNDSEMVVITGGSTLSEILKDTDVVLNPYQCVIHNNNVAGCACK